MRTRPGSGLRGDGLALRRRPGSCRSISGRDRETSSRTRLSAESPLSNARAARGASGVSSPALVPSLVETTDPIAPERAFEFWRCTALVRFGDIAGPPPLGGRVDRLDVGGRGTGGGRWGAAPPRPSRPRPDGRARHGPVAGGHRVAGPRPGCTTRSAIRARSTSGWGYPSPACTGTRTAGGRRRAGSCHRPRRRHGRGRSRSWGHPAPASGRRGGPPRCRARRRAPGNDS